jgi:hypothetical protein
MDMLLTETGYKPTDDQRFRIFLTNSLEEAHPDSKLYLVLVVTTADATIKRFRYGCDREPAVVAKVQIKANGL